MIFGMELTYSQSEYKDDVKFIDASTTGYKLPTSVNEISDFNLTLKSLLTNGLKVKFATDDIRLRPNLTTNKTIKFTEKNPISLQ